MTVCNWTDAASGGVRCKRCGKERATRAIRNCDRRLLGDHIARQGPGDYLEEILRSRFKWTKGRGCNCKKMVQLMNAWGPQGCRDNLGKIVGQMIQEAVRRGWKMDGRPLLSLAASAGTRLPGGMIFAKVWARRLVLQAIRRSERDEKEKADSVCLRNNDGSEPSE